MQSARLIIDVQQAQSSRRYAAYGAPNFISRINNVIDKVRLADAAVIFIQHESTDGVLDFGSDGWQLADGLNVLDGDTLIRKCVTDAFHNTELHQLLTGKNIGHLVICGFQSDFCVDSTTNRALGLGYAVLLISDAHSTIDNDVLTATQITQHHNVTLANIDSYPVRVKLVKAHDVGFE